MSKATAVIAALLALAGTSANAMRVEPLPQEDAGPAPTAQGKDVSALRPLDSLDFQELERVTTTFDLRAGETLRQALTRWAGEAGWQVVWQSTKDYRIEVSMTFPRGTDFKSAARDTAQSIWRVNPTLKLRVYKNNVMVVEEVQG